MKETAKMVQWTFSEIWNNSLLTFDKREIVPRDYIYCSEVLGPYIDRYLKMTGVKFSNPPNERSLRKFQAGNLFEWIIGYVLRRAGILQDRQLRVHHQHKNYLRVSGKLDFIAGGQPDWEAAERHVKDLDLPEFFAYASLQIVGQLRARYGNKFLEENVLEAKSVSSFVFEKLITTNEPLPHHASQNYLYCMAYKLPGKLTYICRDDMRLIEHRIEPTDLKYFDLYTADVEQMTYFYEKKKMPPKEQELTFDEGTYKFRANWKVEYSPYLSLVYGYKTPMEFRDKYLSMSARFNRVFKRCVDCATMTAQNVEVIKEARKMFKVWDDWVEAAKIAKAKGLLKLEEETI